MKINVTQRDIEKGLREDPNSCPVARAIKRRGFEDVSVKTQVIWIGCRKYNPPEIVEDFIERFDKGDTVQPFKFELDFS